MCLSLYMYLRCALPTLHRNTLNQAAQQIEVRKHQKVVEAAQQEGKES